MTYGQFQSECAARGFTFTPLSFSQWSRVIQDTDDHSCAMDVACDVASGVSFNNALRAAIFADIDSELVGKVKLAIGSIESCLKHARLGDRTRRDLTQALEYERERLTLLTR